MSLYGESGQRCSYSPRLKSTDSDTLRNNFPDFEDARSRLSGRQKFTDRFFSPSARKTGEDILRDLKEQLKKESDMFFNSPDFGGFGSKFHADDAEDWARKNMEEFRSRQRPFFKMSSDWGPEDDIDTEFVSRMPQWARRVGSWRERKNSGGSAMSATSEDDSDKLSHSSGGSGAAEHHVTHEIPIRIEMEDSPHPPQVGRVRREPQFATRVSPEDVEPHRETRASSAPPEAHDQNDQTGKGFVSKVNIGPHPKARTNTFPPGSPFNNVPKPFVPHYKRTQEPTTQNTSVIHGNKGHSNEIPESNTPQCSIHEPQGPQKEHCVRTIPIFMEDPADCCSEPSEKSRVRHGFYTNNVREQDDDDAAQPTSDPVMEKMNSVKATLEKYKMLVGAFLGSRKDKEFLYLDEMLTRAMLQLDDIETGGRDDIRHYRRSLIKDISSALSELEARAAEGDTTEGENKSEASECKEKLISEEINYNTEENIKEDPSEYETSPVKCNVVCLPEEEMSTDHVLSKNTSVPSAGAMCGECASENADIIESCANEEKGL